MSSSPCDLVSKPNVYTPWVEEDQNKKAISEFDTFCRNREHCKFEVKISCRPINNINADPKSSKLNMLQTLGTLGALAFFSPALVAVALGTNAFQCRDKIFQSEDASFRKILVHFSLELYWFSGNHAFTLERTDKGLFFSVTDTVSDPVFVPNFEAFSPLKVSLEAVRKHLVEDSAFLYHVRLENCQHFSSKFWQKQLGRPPPYKSDFSKTFCKNIQEQYWQEQAGRI
jgi:hypothetical protein